QKLVIDADLHVSDGSLSLVVAVLVDESAAAERGPVLADEAHPASGKRLTAQQHLARNVSHFGFFLHGTAGDQGQQTQGQATQPDQQGRPAVREPKRHASSPRTLPAPSRVAELRV